MELRTLRYFIAVAQEGSLTNASKRLHITQPTLSRQLADLERELGRQLFFRTRDGVELTEYGTVLLDYAQSITELVSKAEEDIKIPERSVTGSVHIAAGETRAMSILAQAMRNTRSKYPGIDFQLHSGTSTDLMDGLVRGQYDFLLECELQPHVNLNVLELPFRDRWGVVVPSDHPLATKDSVQLDDIASFPLIPSRQAQQVGSLRRWFGDRAESLEIVATYGLLMNVKWLVKSGFGIALAFEGLIASSAETSPEGLSFVLLDPPVHSRNGLLWRKTMLSCQAQAFLDEVNALCLPSSPSWISAADGTAHGCRTSEPAIPLPRVSASK